MSHTKFIFCEKCRVPIRSKEELVTSSFFFLIATYHDRCFSQEIKGLISAFLSWPINGIQGNLTAIFASIAFIVMLLIPEVPIIIKLGILVPILMRVASWTFFERHLP
ncbi:hypothetical protein [Bacillus horti]|uniref:Permease n=1 Tax=Caldalkalibacillus horti TaxID=77523 RepID=A0ABT9W539_9BACI|nr:hypothetical protein [Bacillus horti]MDQ0168363.1 hypothetical protein [Bacillus horti]